MFWKKISQCSENILTCLHHVQIAFSECSETFSLFRNIPECPVTIQIFLGNISKILRNTFSYPETIRFVLETFQKKCSRTYKYFLKKVFTDHSDLFSRLFCFQNIPKYSDLFRNIPDDSGTFKCVLSCKLFRNNLECEHVKFLHIQICF